ncbi:MAG: cyclophilin-like fold protein [Ignisphaera sp.]
MNIVKVKICTNEMGCIDAELTDSYSPNTFKKVVEALPIESTAYRWGDEIYFSTNISMLEENAKEVVEKGTIAYWPPGQALCIFWGPTPVSRSEDEIRPASPVNIIGKVLGDPTKFSKVRNGSRIKIERVS